MKIPQVLPKIQKLPLFSKITFLFSILTHGSFFLGEYGRDWDFDLPEGIIVLSMWIGSVKYLTERRYVFRLALGLMIVFSVYFLTFYDTNPVLVFLLSSVMILEIVSLETMPVNIVFFLFFPLLHYAAYRVLLLDQYIPATGMVSYLLGLVLWGGGGVLLIYYRERLIRSNVKVEQANSAILKLNQANREYQEYLVKVEAEAMNAERNRITRDIHDIVGYTLTNNIVLMEMATDIVQTNPLELTKLLKTARENAQDGQERIREILYKYRKESYEIATGVSNIARQVDVFGYATGVHIDISYGNTSDSFGPEIDSAVFHLIQESMLNAYCHGRATAIGVQLYVLDDILHVVIRDNGDGVDTVIEGIGIKGMKERLHRVDGTLHYGNITDGFQVRGEIPWKRQNQVR